MLKPKVVKTVDEVAQGQPLRLQDLEFGWVCLSDFPKLPEKHYSLNIPEAIKFRYPEDDMRNPQTVKKKPICRVYKGSSITKPLSSVSVIFMPLIKNCLVEELLLDWALPELYESAARSFRDSLFQISAVMFSTAILSFKKLVEEFITYFVVEDRIIVKNIILSRKFSMNVVSMCDALAFGLSMEIKDLKDNYDFSEISQEIVDKWIYLTNLAAALSAEGNDYTRAYNLHQYNEYLEKVKSGIETDYVVEHPDKETYRYMYSRPPIALLNNFIKERQLALNPVVAENTVPVTVGTPMLKFATGWQKASAFASSFSSDTVSTSEEQMTLLDAKYKPIYVPPREVAHSSIDAEICSREERLLQRVAKVGEYGVDDLLKIAKDSLNLLSFIHMRYKVSLDSSNDYVYFGLIKTNAAIDKDNYCRILGVYYESICSKTFVVLSTSLNKEPALYVDEMAEFVKNVKNLKNYLQEMPNQNDPEIQAKILELKNIIEPSFLAQGATALEGSGMRQRKTAFSRNKLLS